MAGLHSLASLLRWWPVAKSLRASPNASSGGPPTASTSGSWASRLLGSPCLSASQRLFARGGQAFWKSPAVGAGGGMLLAWWLLVRLHNSWAAGRSERRFASLAPDPGHEVVFRANGLRQPPSSSRPSIRSPIVNRGSRVLVGTYPPKFFYIAVHESRGKSASAPNRPAPGCSGFESVKHVVSITFPERASAGSSVAVCGCK